MCGDVTDYGDINVLNVVLVLGVYIYYGVIDYD